MTRPRRPASPAPPAPRASEDLSQILISLGALLALGAPFFFYSLASSDALRESKLLAQATGAVIALAGLALGKTGLPSPRGLSWTVRAGVALAFLLALVSALAHASRVDPLTAGPILSALALVACGASASGESVRSRVFALLMLAGAFTGALATLQRYAGVFRLPLEAPEPRFFAAGLIGNPGDVGAALVVPALLFWMALFEPASLRSRALLAAGLGATLLGLLVTQSLAPLAAIAVGASTHFLFAPKRRLGLFAGGVAVLLAALFVTGAGGRVVEKLRQAMQGRLGAAATQRDIGILAAFEMVRGNPILGVGPGAFSNAFVPARIAAEERAGRRLKHDSGSAHFENAHNEPLTLAAECGVPTAVAAVAAVLAVLFALVKRKEDAFVALLLSLGVLSLASFPLRLPVAAGPAAFLFGLALRRVSTVPGESPQPVPGARWPWALGAAVLALAVGLRAAAAWSQASGEAALGAAVMLPGPARAALLEEARADLRRSVGLRPAAATAWLALGSTHRAEGDFTSALPVYERSLRIEERAETDFSIGLCHFGRGAAAEARASFVRALWILPALASSLPEEADPQALVDEVERLAAGLASGGRAPALPSPVEAPR